MVGEIDFDEKYDDDYVERIADVLYRNYPLDEEELDDPTDDALWKVFRDFGTDVDRKLDERPSYTQLRVLDRLDEKYRFDHCQNVSQAPASVLKGFKSFTSKEGAADLVLAFYPDDLDFYCEVSTGIEKGNPVIYLELGPSYFEDLSSFEDVKAKVNTITEIALWRLRFFLRRRGYSVGVDDLIKQIYPRLYF